jgi:hypothetical protein
LQAIFAPQPGYRQPRLVAGDDRFWGDPHRVRRSRYRVGLGDAV